MAQAGKPRAEQASETGKEVTERAAERGHRAVDQAGDVAREMTDRGQEAALQGLWAVNRVVGSAGEVQQEVARRSAEETAELGRVLVDLTVAQTQQNLDTFKALTGAVDWAQVAQAVDWQKVLEIQSEHMRVSLERTSELAQRYLQLSKAVLAATASAAQRQAHWAA